MRKVGLPQVAMALFSPSPPKTKRRVDAKSLLKEDKTVVSLDGVIEVDGPAEEEVPGQQSASSHVPRRRALKRRQTSQSPVIGPGKGDGSAHERALSADSGAALAGEESSATARVPEFSPKCIIGGGKESLKLREMLLSQLDVIKKQSDVIMAKDRALRVLQHENERLRLRLRQMEEERLTVQTLPASTTSAGGGPSLQARHAVVPHTQKKQRQDKSVLTDISALIVPITVGSGTGEKSGLALPTKKRQRGHQEVVGKRRLKSVERAPDLVRRKRTFLESTDGEYPLLRGEDYVESEQSEIRGILESSSEIPGWKKVPTPVPLYSMEGTENVEDAALLEPEAIEKRQKRWDIQHAREQRRLARLKATYEKSQWNAQGSIMARSNKVDSLHPALEGVTHLCLSDKVPVTAFGLLAPPEWAVEERMCEGEKRVGVEFSLPWTVVK